ncbi:hypothetical protein CQ12_31115 [Bradyrhizobium jicamae]|uniref:Uncharacterized protein n=1 Tax=Bradyrhizobium jicamae TaxID=280332 RepID=A0A0R3L7A4_9BRAD|nr:hypothetical protein CQ12_31115 [Bradyrhizobium jicamae]
MDQAAAVQGRHVVGIERQRAVEFRQRLFGLPGFDERLAACRVALGIADALSADRAGRLLFEDLRLFLVRSPRSQVERTAAERKSKNSCKQRDRCGRQARGAGRGIAIRNGHAAEDFRIRCSNS